MTTTNMTPERLAEIEEILKGTCTGKRILHVRPDGTMCVSLGNREVGEHQQADFLFSEGEARFFTDGKSIVQDLLAEVHRLKGELAKMEKERDVLAEQLAEQADLHNVCDKCPCMCSENDCPGDWLQWAAQQANHPTND